MVSRLTVTMRPPRLVQRHPLFGVKGERVWRLVFTPSMKFYRGGALRY